MWSNSGHRRRSLFADGRGWMRGVAIGMVVGVVATSRPALADEPVDANPGGVALAERRAAEAFEAYSRAEYANAVALYLQAYAASASAPILYNIARIYDVRLGNRAQAIEYYRRYVSSADARADLVETTRRRLAQLEEEEASPAAGTGPSTGAAAPQAKRPAEPSAPPVVPPPPRQGGWSTERWVGVVLGTAGLVGVGIGSAFGLAARSNANTAHQLCNGNVCSTQAGVDAARAGSRDATLSDIGFGVGGALLATGTILYFMGGDRSPDRAGERNLQVQARASASDWAVQVAGRW